MSNLRSRPNLCVQYVRLLSRAHHKIAKGPHTCVSERITRETKRKTVNKWVICIAHKKDTAIRHVDI